MRLGLTSIEPEIEFKWKGDVEAESVEIALGGDWDLKVEMIPFGRCTKKQFPNSPTDGFWSATIQLDPGMHKYVFFVNGSEVHDPELPLLVEKETGRTVNIINVAGNVSLKRW